MISAAAQRRVCVRPIADIAALWDAVVMRLIVTFFSLLLTACSNVHASKHDALIAQVEQTVRLPSGAKKLEDYARYYAPMGNRVVGIYITSVEPQERFEDLPVGQRRWVDDYRNLPVISDGGCSVVEVIYDPASRKVEQAVCNGFA